MIVMLIKAYHKGFGETLSDARGSLGCPVAKSPHRNDCYAAHTAWFYKRCSDHMSGSMHSTHSREPKRKVLQVENIWALCSIIFSF